MSSSSYPWRKLTRRLLKRASLPAILLLVATAAAEEPAPESEVSTTAAPATPGPQPNKSAFRLDASNSSTVLYAGDNRDTRSGEVGSLANDEYGMLRDRLDLKLNSTSFSFALRLDGYAFFSRPNPTQIGLDLVEIRTEAGGPTDGEPDNPTYFRQKVYDAGSELSNRYINWLIPTKLSATYKNRQVQATVGDFYAQFGRGLVLSVRKEDALSSDTTIRGAKASFDAEVEDIQIETTILAGSANPLRVDDTSGRYLGVHKNGKKGFQVVTEAGMPRAIETDFAPLTDDCETTATCSFAPENLYGAEIQVAPRGFRLSGSGSLLDRHTNLSNDIARASQQILTGSGAIDVISLLDLGSLYFEGAGQRRSYESTNRNGYALYTQLALLSDPVILTFEGKHYRAFYPLSAGISTARAREYSQLQYSKVPTTEAVWNTSEFENFNTCTTGGRTRADFRLSEQASLHGWLARYNTWAESVANDECEIADENLNRVWDLAVGTELLSETGRTHAEVTIGVRDDTTARLLEGPWGSTHVFYREAYARYDTAFHISGPYSLQFQGWHRYKHQTVGGQLNPWFTGQTVNALDVASLGTIALGIEYDTQARTPDLYLNGQLSYRISEASLVSLFVGQRSGAQSCVGGVCRVYPPFEGARLDWKLRL